MYPSYASSSVYRLWAIESGLERIILLTPVACAPMLEESGVRGSERSKGLASYPSLTRRQEIERKNRRLGVDGWLRNNFKMVDFIQPLILPFKARYGA